MKWLPPEVLETSRRQFGVPDRVLDIAMTEISLQSSRIMAGIGQGEAAGMPEHMRMCLEIEAGSIASALDHLGEAGSRERRTALTYKHER